MPRDAPPTVALYDVDGRVPNLALMKLSSYYKRQGHMTELLRRPKAVEAELRFASVVFRTPRSQRIVNELRRLYGDGIQIGGSGVDLTRRLPPDVEACFPDYGLYRHDLYALGFLTRGCRKRCAFCVVPAKEGPVKKASASFSDFVPLGQRNVMLLDDNLLSYDGVNDLLAEMAERGFAVNFSQTLDIAYLTKEKHELLLKVDSRNARFTRRRIYFSWNHPAVNRLFVERRDMLRAYGPDCVSVVCMYGFNTTLSQDYSRFLTLRRLMLVPFFQEYWPIEGVPSRLPSPFFDMDLDAMIRLTFRSNGQNWEKYLRWLNRLYFETFGRYYVPLLEIIYRYNHRAGIERYRAKPHLLTRSLYRTYPTPPEGSSGPGRSARAEQRALV